MLHLLFVQIPMEALLTQNTYNFAIGLLKNNKYGLGTQIFFFFYH
jgi:hypothetical protein